MRHLPTSIAASLRTNALQVMPLLHADRHSTKPDVVDCHAEQSTGTERESGLSVALISSSWRCAAGTVQQWNCSLPGKGFHHNKQAGTAACLALLAAAVVVSWRSEECRQTSGLFVAPTSSSWH